ncbi:MAG: AMP-binding protein [Deltaproteobacteria bacterium]|nr:AMP-binding protein [Deltaproteobacteria bacterium]
MDLKTAFRMSAQRASERIAVVDGKKRYTYKGWMNRVYELGNVLQRLGVTKGDRVLVGLKNREQSVLALMALHVVGAIAVPYNPRSGGPTVDYYMRDSGAAGVFFEEATEAALEEVLPKFPECRFRISVDGKRECVFKGCPDFYDLEELLRGDEVNEPSASVSAEDVGLLLYTSGTTGEPKGVPLTHEASIFRVLGLATNHGMVFDNDHRVIGVMPLYHTIGFHGSFLTAILYDGTYYPVPDFNPGEVISLIEDEKISHVFGSPTHFHLLLEHPDFTPDRVASVRDAFYAGAPMAPEMVKKCAAMLTENFTHIYGNTETYDSGYYRRAGCKPRAARQGMWHTVRIVKPGGSAEDVVSPGTEGELIISLHSPEAFTGYWNKPRKTAEVCRDGWYFTGDAARYDANGDWFITGRIDDMIISGGENIHPAEVENALLQHPDITDTAVIGVGDERWGQVVKAFVVVKNPNITIKEVDQFILKHAQLDRWKRPKQYMIIDSIPRNASGKVLRYLLREKYSG